MLRTERQTTQAKQYVFVYWYRCKGDIIYVRSDDVYKLVYQKQYHLNVQPLCIFNKAILIPKTKALWNISGAHLNEVAYTRHSIIEVLITSLTQTLPIIASSRLKTNIEFVPIQLFTIIKNSFLFFTIVPLRPYSTRLGF